MNKVRMPAVLDRRRVGQIRHLVITAAHLGEGAVAELSRQVAHELAELWFLPAVGTTFTPYQLHNADVGHKELLASCKEESSQHQVLKHFFPDLQPADAKWHFTVLPFGTGVVVKAIVGHIKSMQVAREHGLVA